MAPLSVLPGRVRFEASILIGCKEGCLLLEESMLSVQGVIEASASHRTGRVLVRFDESTVTRSDIEEQVGRALQAISTPGDRKTGVCAVRWKAPSRGASSSHAGNFVIEMALHALLPAPLDILLPAAATVLRR